MNAFIPEKPVVVIQLDEHGLVKRSANNIDPNLEIRLAADELTFKHKSAGIPYDSANPRVQTQVLARKKS